MNGADAPGSPLLRAIRAIERIGAGSKRSKLLPFVLWGGFALCVFALFRSWKTLEARLYHADAWQLAALVFLLYCGWALAVASWRQMVYGWTGQRMDWRSAFRQSGYLLTGKYLPGGIFGFAARFADQRGQARSSAAVAGVSEQIMGLGLVLGCGLLAYAAGSQGAVWILLFLPVVVLATCWFVQRCGELILTKAGQAAGASRHLNGSLLLAGWLSFAQQATTLATAFVIAMSLFAAAPAEALAVAGAYAISIGVGTLVVFVPGGIGIRESVLTALVLPWMPPAEGIALAAMLRVISMVLDLSAGLLAMTWARHKHP